MLLTTKTLCLPLLRLLPTTKAEVRVAVAAAAEAPHRKLQQKMKMSHLPLQAPPPLPVPSHVKKQSEVSASSSVSKEPERSRSRSRSRGRKRSDSPPSEGDESSDTGGKPGFATEGSSIYLPDHGGRALALNHQQDNSGTTAESPENRRRSDLSYSPPPDAKSDTRSQSSLSSGVSTELRTAQAQHMMALPSQDSIRLPLRSIARARGEGAAGPPRPSAAESSPRSDWSHSQSNSCLSESSQLNLWGSERQPPLAPDPLHSPTMSRGATPMGAASSRLSRSGHGGPSFGLSDSPAPAVGGRASGLLASATPARTTPSSLSPPTHMAQPSGAGKGSSPSPSDPPPPPRMPMFPELPSYPRFERDPLIEPEGMKRPQPSRAHKSSRVKYLVVFDDKHLAHVRTTHFPSKVKRIKDWLISWAEREEDALLCFNFCEILDLFGYIDGVCMVINGLSV
uniref:Uncharacterized protein n=1 Tax=Chromera velia CCMP2878 TaxID=1169474 RepID=A0A0G4G8G4_9ALVE|eukprot:Cvel_20682.t1-p1 / transcript=Cvel_20682.t1 / gene=Cvel_20682 / organism=Chromera_velia_CCMP2878 / gene_product=hypothetical protein / transcript_product=hypothetical protein / location=Cvel_scaffold1880:10-2054(-) / protein_length=452 / sequence_SO=supercontig / SO=protein_coding / is_pseudo=false